MFARDKIVVRFEGQFVDEIPEDQFTVVLKKVRGEDAVPLFQTLTFHVNLVGYSHVKHHMVALYEIGEQIYD